MKLIYIEWCDAVASGNEWQDLYIAEEWGRKSDWVVKGVGWLIEETKEYIVLAAEYKPSDEFMDAQVKQLIKIPKTWIRKRKTIKP